MTAFRLTLETRARWQAAADRNAYQRLDVWAYDTLDAASDPDADQVVEAERRECLCEICGHEYAVWFAPSELWNAVMRGGDRGNPDRISFVCPTCFALEAESFGVVPTAWVLTQEDPDLRARLTTAETERDQAERGLVKAIDAVRAAEAQRDVLKLAMEDDWSWKEKAIRAVARVEAAERELVVQATLALTRKMSRDIAYRKIAAVEAILADDSIFCTERVDRARAALACPPQQREAK